LITMTNQETKRDLPTMAPTAADDDVRAFEAAIAKLGETRARWGKLMELLGSNEE
jgi:hypothetical protein